METAVNKTALFYEKPPSTSTNYTPCSECRGMDTTGLCPMCAQPAPDPETQARECDPTVDGWCPEPGSRFNRDDFERDMEELSET